MDPHLEAALLARQQFLREVASERRLAEAFAERRLAEAFAERDRTPDSAEEDRVMPGGKTYTCGDCGEVFEKSQHYAGHRNKHLKLPRGPSGKAKRPRAAARPAAEVQGGPVCPTCAQALPPSVRVVVEDFIRRGLSEEKAIEVAAAAYGLLTIPGD